MAIFVALVNWTDEGVRTARETVDRAQAVAQLAERMGGSMESLYWTLGPYDLIATMNFPDDETATAFGLAVGSQGNVRTATFRAFNEGEMQQILGKLS